MYPCGCELALFAICHLSCDLSLFIDETAFIDENCHAISLSLLTKRLFIDENGGFGGRSLSQTAISLSNGGSIDENGEPFLKRL